MSVSWGVLMVPSRVLIRVPKRAAGALKERGFAAVGGKFRVSPLFEVSPGAAGFGAAVAEGAEWLLAETEGEPDADNQWDLAHGALIQPELQGFGAAAGEIVVEPDLLQSWFGD